MVGSCLNRLAPALRCRPGHVVEQQAGFQVRRANQRRTSIVLDGKTEAGLTPTRFIALVLSAWQNAKAAGDHKEEPHGTIRGP
jgi:hypothetical protein